MTPGPRRAALNDVRPPWIQRTVQSNAGSPLPCQRQRVTLPKGVHEALAGFRWLAEDVSKRPTHIYKLVLLRTTVNGYHDASSYMYGGVVLPVPTAIFRVLSPQPSPALPCGVEGAFPKRCCGIPD